MRMHAPAGDQPPLHVHQHEDEGFYVLEGTLTLVTSAPGTFPGFLRAAGTPAARSELPVLDGPPDAERLAAIAADHGITLLGPPGLLPTALVS